MIAVAELQGMVSASMHLGPPLVTDLTTILTRFWLKRYALMADIEKAFLQIGLAPQYRDVTRFFWHDPDAQDLDGLMNIYRFKVLLFGATSSPFILHATVQKHLASADSDTTRLLQDSLYVDNAITAVDTVEDASRSCVYVGEQCGCCLVEVASRHAKAVLLCSDDRQKRSRIVGSSL